MSSHAPIRRSPTTALLCGLVLTLAAIVVYSWYISVQISGLRRLQSDLQERDRKDSLQLIRIQNDLTVLALSMRDMLDNDEPYPLTAYSAQFERVRGDLDDALRHEEQVGSPHTAEQRQYLANSLAQFWDASSRIFADAAGGHDKEAREQIRLSLLARHASLTTAVSRLLVQNNESEEQAAQQTEQIYSRVQHHVYQFLALTLVVILFTSLYLIQSNRRVFAQIAALSEQRSDLAQKLIATQESTLHYVSRELHDEFGQILTAVGLMLGRSRKHIAEDSPLHGELNEVREIVQSTLQSVRSLSQALHPVMLEESGLEATLDWYLPTVERQTGIAISFEKSGTPFPIESRSGVQIYRVLQEALNNVARHSGAKEAWVRLRYSAETLELEVEDHGVGFGNGASKHPGIGLVAIRERAELLGGEAAMLAPAAGGALVRLTVPREGIESDGK